VEVADESVEDFDSVVVVETEEELSSFSVLVEVGDAAVLVRELVRLEVVVG
jgi:hypothetical protein